MAAPTTEFVSTLLNAVNTAPETLRGIGRGIEKESLRVTPDGALSGEPHPQALGSALTHPNITTDFSEAQLELITGVHKRPSDCLDELVNVHRFVYANIGTEVLWPASMPCILNRSENIPVGRYGTSNIGQAKTVYRLGLGNRYGRLMQTISGIHYNFSLPDAFWPRVAPHYGLDDDSLRTKLYFDLIRNFRRHSWLLIYLFGGSPAVCKSFTNGLGADVDHGLQSYDEGSLYLPNATSLRMGRLGYQSDAQSALHVSYNSLAEYAATMLEALRQPYPPYADIGVRDAEGRYRQLNTSLIQIENEFYGTIRPKQPVQPGERPLVALDRRGVRYVEVRCLDLNPFLPVGIDAQQVRFLDVFLLYCLLSESPPDTPDESARLQRNQITVVEQGRAPGLSLEGPHGATSMRSWAAEILEGCAVLAGLLDAANDGEGYGRAVDAARVSVADPHSTPSARVLEAMRQAQVPFFRFAMNQANAHAAYFAERRLDSEERASWGTISSDSHARQRAIEDADEVDFEAFLERYLALPEAIAAR